MTSHTSAEIHAYAKWLAQECRAAGLNAEHHGDTVLVIAADHHLSERVRCRADAEGALKWWWSWDRPITDLRDPARELTPDDVTDLVAAIRNVVALPVPRT
jgi:hypothetical protein